MLRCIIIRVNFWTCFLPKREGEREHLLRSPSRAAPPETLLLTKHSVMSVLNAACIQLTTSWLFAPPYMYAYMQYITLYSLIH
jgi:hypothetical protein